MLELSKLAVNKMKNKIIEIMMMMIMVVVVIMLMVMILVMKKVSH
jgi:hypothetical protein